MKLTDKFDVSPDVAAREIGGETMLLDLASGTYFGLDPIGGRVWQLLEEGRTLAQTCETIAGEYEVDRTILEQDLLALAEELAVKRLLIVAE